MTFPRTDLRCPAPLRSAIAVALVGVFLAQPCHAASPSEASVQFSARAIEGSAIGVGVVLQASVSATGTLLISAGRAVMFIPN